MGNCRSCLERARVTAYDDDWGLPTERFPAGAGARGVSAAADNGSGGGGTRVKIRMTKGQLRRLLESTGRGGAADEDVVAEIMSMGTVQVDVFEFQQAAAERHRRPPPNKLETIQEDDLDDGSR